MTRLCLVPVLLATALSACAVGPDYKTPATPAPDAYKESAGWKPVTPKLAASDTAWWTIYDDPTLDALERQVAVTNQNLKASEAAYRQAVAVVDEARASLFPTLSLDGSAARSGRGKGSSGSAIITSTSGVGTSFSSARVSNQFGISADASWTVDLWGSIRRTIESDVATAQASAAQLAGATLSAQATLATDYFTLRSLDSQARLLDETVDAYARSLTITRNQYQEGVAAKSDVITAETQWRGAQSQRIGIDVQRATLEHAIAVLIGKTPANFALERQELATTVPVIPAGVPSELLERRPDIAAAERSTAAANAQIGVNLAAWYPSLTLSGTYGVSSTAIDQLFRASNVLWSFGSQAAETVFDAGARSARVAGARAAYDQAVATYRQTALAGFQQVEDELATLRILEQQADVEAATVASAREAERLALNEYKAGTMAYTAVVTAQATALAADETLLTIRQNRLIASATLVEALGGGWQSSDLPKDDRLADAVAP